LLIDQIIDLILSVADRPPWPLTGTNPRKGGISTMRKYELFVIVHPDLDEANFQAVVEKVSGWVTEVGGNVDKIDVWGRRRMAYMINKQREGQYALLHLTMDPKGTSELNRNIRFQESIMRSMLSAV